jgi:integrator complex subunit 1
MLSVSIVPEFIDSKYLPLLGPSAFIELLEAWFPEKGNMPSGYLVNTSEEALLLPDWLKLRMIRCRTDRLVNAGLYPHYHCQILYLFRMHFQL